MNFTNKKIMIVGSGISGKGAAAALKSVGASFFFFNDESDFEKEIDFIIVSPGIPLDNPVFAFAKRNRVPVAGEIELGYMLCNKPIIAITGTNGKTTITELIGKILECDGQKPLVCGNIGNAFSEAVTKNNFDVVVLEVSSFQLETIKKFRADIAIISNITPDHLDRHKTMKTYVDAKFKIVKNQTKEDYFIFSDKVRPYVENKKIKAKLCNVAFGRKDCGAYILGDEIFYNDERVVFIDEIRMRGNHNVENTMLAITACKIWGVDNRSIHMALKMFSSGAYRIAFSGEYNGKSFYNDSKGTNIDASICACLSMQGETCLIVGGSDKGYDFDRLFIELPEKIVHVVAVGNTAEKIYKSAVRTGFPNISIAESISGAVRYAVGLRVKNVLLSPATASFDLYSDYAERGRDFDRIVGELSVENG